MSGNKRFRTSFLGFNREDVIIYIEKMITSFCDELENKERQICEMRDRMEMQSAPDDTHKAATILLDARRTADTIIAEARMVAKSEKALIAEEIAKGYEELDAVSSRILAMRLETARCLANVENEIGKISLTTG